MLLEWLGLGGWPMLLLLGLSLVAATLSIVKIWEFWEWRISRQAFVAPVLQACGRHQPDQALGLLAGERGPLAAVLTVAVAARADPAIADMHARERAEAAAQHWLERMRSFMRALDVIAQLAPLLGLFGTVLGMIDAFQAMQAAGGTVEASGLAGGIWKALLTTAAGLAVAMPVITVLQAFERVIDAQRVAMESALTALFTQPAGAARRAA
ncbi:MAG: MotA/TolQ/ExbB proton channel family protein [Nevskiales bacterium]|nr:MotA/TolQ/ExbB proton channel family protein [Nevskiales bacterium]